MIFFMIKELMAAKVFTRTKSFANGELKICYENVNERGMWLFENHFRLHKRVYKT